MLSGLPKWLRVKIGLCKQCQANRTRHTIVMGEGILPCKFLLIGGCSDKVSDITGEAFTGWHGHLLDSMLSDAKIARHTVACMLSVFCRPLDAVGETRDPNKREIANCRSRILEIICVAQPEAVIFADREAQKAYKGFFDAEGIPHTTIYSPAYVKAKGGDRATEYFHNVRMLEDLKSKITT